MDNKNNDYFYNMLLDLAWKRFSEIWQDKRDIENKSATLLSFSGVILGLILNAVYKIGSLGSSASYYYLIIILGSIISILALVVTSIFCILILKPKKYATFSLQRSWEDFRKEYLNNNKSVPYLKSILYYSISEKEKINSKILENSAILLEFAVYSFLIAIIASALVALMTLLMIC